jgi:hypothetical protein
MAEDFLRRWSRLKHENAPKPEPDPQPPAEKALAQVEAKPLPPVETLTPDSDFTGFMQPKVEDALRRAALKTLFKDPHFNVPDPYEAYSGDWTGGAPATPTGIIDAALDKARAILATDGEEPNKPAAPAAEQAAEPPAKGNEGEAREDGARRQDA